MSEAVATHSGGVNTGNNSGGYDFDSNYYNEWDGVDGVGNGAQENDANTVSGIEESGINASNFYPQALSEMNLESYRATSEEISDGSTNEYSLPNGSTVVATEVKAIALSNEMNLIAERMYQEYIQHQASISSNSASGSNASRKRSRNGTVVDGSSVSAHSHSADAGSNSSYNSNRNGYHNSSGGNYGSTHDGDYTSRTGGSGYNSGEQGGHELGSDSWKVDGPKLGAWSLTEDDRLHALRSENPDWTWAQIAAQIPGRNPKQCRERWTHYLQPGMRKGAWDPDEDRIVRQLFDRYGKKWATIARELKELGYHRSDNAIKNRFNTSATNKETTARNARIKQWKERIETTRKALSYHQMAQNRAIFHEMHILSHYREQRLYEVFSEMCTRLHLEAPSPPQPLDLEQVFLESPPLSTEPNRPLPNLDTHTSPSELPTVIVNAMRLSRVTQLNMLYFQLNMQLEMNQDAKVKKLEAILALIYRYNGIIYYREDPAAAARAAEEGLELQPQPVEEEKLLEWQQQGLDLEKVYDVSDYSEPAAAMNMESAASLEAMDTNAHMGLGMGMGMGLSGNLDHTYMDHTEHQDDFVDI